MYRLCMTMNSTDTTTGFPNETCSNRTGPQLGYQPESSVREIIRITSITCYILILVMSTLGNSTIIAIVLWYKSMQSKANVLIVNMAVSDLLATLFALPRNLDVAVSNSFKWKVPSVIAEAACKLGPFMREVSCAVSIFSMVAIALDRFFAIVVPLARKPVLLKLKFLIPGIWWTALGANALNLYAFQVEFHPRIGLRCFNALTTKQETIFDSFRFVVFIAVPFLVLVTLYSAIAFKMRQTAIPGATVQSFAKNRRKQNKNILKLAIAIVVFFFVFWIPYYILLLLFIFQDWQVKMSSKFTLTIIFILQHIFTILTYASSAINPFICIVFSSNFRRHTRRTFCRSHSPKTLTFTQRTTRAMPTHGKQTMTRPLSLSNLDISLMQVTGIENQAHKDEET